MRLTRVSTRTVSDMSNPCSPLANSSSQLLRCCVISSCAQYSMKSPSITRLQGRFALLEVVMSILRSTRDTAPALHSTRQQHVVSAHYLASP